MREGEAENEIDKIYEKPTEERNGAKVIINVDYSDRSTWSDKFREQLCYFKNIFVDDHYNQFDNNFKIYENKLFKFSSICPEQYLHICLADVYYSISFDKLGIDRIKVPFGLNFELGEGIEPTPSREKIKLTVESKKIILDRIKDVADFCISRYNENTANYDTFLEAEPFINPYTIIIELNERKINITELKKYSSIEVITPEVKGYNNLYLNQLKDSKDNLVEFYQVPGKIQYHGGWKLKYNYFSVRSFTENKDNYALVSDLNSSIFREYLQDQKKEKNFLKQKELTLFGGYSTKGYVDILKLRKYPKKDWRTIIKEYHKLKEEIFTGLKSYVDFVIPEDWLEDRRDRMKTSGTWKTLDKQIGEVTIGYAREKIHSSNFKFDKETFKILELPKQYYYTIYSTNENKEKLSNLQKIFNYTSKRHRTAIIGARESNKIKHFQNFKTIEEFMETSLYKKYATAQLAYRVYKDIKDIMNVEKLDIIFNTITTKYKDSYDKFSEYGNRWDASIDRNGLAEEICEFAKLHNHYDLEMLNEIKIVQREIEKYKFLTFLDLPSYPTEDQIAEFKNLVNKILVFEKVHKKEFEGWSLTPPPIVEVPTETEELIEENI